MFLLIVSDATMKFVFGRLRELFILVCLGWLELNGRYYLEAMDIATFYSCYSLCECLGMEIVDDSVPL